MRRANCTRSIRAVIASGWVCALVLLCPAACLTQATVMDSFLGDYNALLLAAEAPEDVTAEAMFNRLMTLHSSHPGVFDSLMIPLFIWDYKRRSSQTGPDARIDLLRDYQHEISELSSVRHQDMARFYGHYIPVFRYRYQADSVSRYLDLIGVHLDKVDGPDEGWIAWFFEKGRNAFDQSDYEASLTFFRSALDYLNTNFPDMLRSKYMLVNAIGIGYRRTNRTVEAIAHYEKALEDLASEIDAVRLTGTFLNNLGLAHKDNGDYAQAIRRLSEAIAYYRVSFSPAYEDIGSGFDNIALCYMEQGKPDSALVFSHQSLEFMKQNLGPGHPDLLLPYATITRTLIGANRLHEAGEVNARAQSLLRDLGWSPDDPSGDYFLADAFGVFASAMAIERAMYRETSDGTHLQRATQYGDYFMGLTDYAYDNLKNDLSKEIFRERYGDVFSACIGDLYLLYQLNRDPALREKAFAYTEKFKSLELLYAAQKDKAEQVDRYKVLTEEYHAQVDSIRHYESVVRETDPGSDSYSRVFAGLTTLKETLYLWKEKTRKAHPDYYQVIYHPPPLALSELQQALPGGDQCILSYHLADSAVYLFVITASDVHFVKQETEVSIPVLISEFRKAVYGFFAGQSGSESEYITHSENYVRAAVALYGYLIAPVSSHLTERVVIVVDKSLGYLPFDLLLTAAPGAAYHFRDHRYLLHDHAISYSYSARLWMDMGRREASPADRILAVAPDFPLATKEVVAVRGLRTGLSKLYFNTAEVREISRIIPAKLLIGSRATKREFIAHCQAYPILHLATHSKANDDQGDDSFLAFTRSEDGGDRLLASEIYNLKLQAELVVLSACETGLGELKSGEGIISLARAFSFAGAKSILSSLWSVNDQSTPAIMSAFYHHLRKGDPRDIALQKAKIGFVTSRGHADAHPFYWGGFICVGDTRVMKIDVPSSGSLVWILLAGALAFVLFFVIRRYRSH